MQVGEVWFAQFPLEEDNTKFLERPVIILDVLTLECLSVKVTKSPPRPDDEFDTPIVYWQQANLRFQSTARVSKTIFLEKSAFVHKIGDLHPEDLKVIQNTFIRYVQNNSQQVI